MKRRHSMISHCQIAGDRKMKALHSHFGSLEVVDRMNSLGLPAAKALDALLADEDCGCRTSLLEMIGG